MPSPGPTEPPFDDYYLLRVPTASSIYTRPTPEETLSALIHANKTLQPKQRLPTEIILLINNEVHTMTESQSEKLRSIWTPFVKTFEIPWGVHSLWAELNEDTKTFTLSEKCIPGKSDLSSLVSSADLLYRVRCLFPKILVDTDDDKYKTIWRAVLRHDQSGSIIIFTEHKGWARLLVIDGEDGKGFSEDLLRLVNMLFETVDGRRFTYYHPAAYADLPAADQHYLAVPGSTYRYTEENQQPYRPWDRVMFPVEDLTSSTFKSLLPQLKYDPKSRKVDSENGTVDLTTIMSSSLLFYRLLCKWTEDSVNYDQHPITSVWQVELQHRKHKVWVLFVDDRGLFDIRVEGDATKAMDDIVALVNGLFSDECSHPYSMVAGTS